MELGGMQILLQVARKGDVEGKTSAVGALLLLSQDKVNVARLSTTANINSLLFLLSTADVDVRMRVAGIFTNLASDRDAADRIRGASVVSSLVEMLHIANEACQSRAALALEALCQVPDAALEVVKSGGLLPLIDMIRSGTPDGKRNAAAVLEQLAQQEIVRATFGDRGGIGALMELSREGTPPARLHAFRALRSLMSNRANQVLAVNKNFVPFFVEMLDIGDMASRSLVVDIIGSMFSGDQALAIAAKVVDAGGVLKLATLLSLREKNDGRLPVIKAFESIAKVEEGALSMLNAKVHTALIQVLESDITKGKGSAAIALRRMAHPGRPDLRLKIAEAGATAALATLMRHATVNFDKIEAAKALLALVEDDTKSSVTGRVDRMDSVLAKFRASVTPEAIEELARIDNGRNEAKTLAKKLKARLAAAPMATPEAEASVDPTLPHGTPVHTLASLRSAV
jgi:vacuolar protein 8